MCCSYMCTKITCVVCMFLCFEGLGWMVSNLVFSITVMAQEFIHECYNIIPYSEPVLRPPPLGDIYRYSPIP